MPSVDRRVTGLLYAYLWESKGRETKRDRDGQREREKEREGEGLLPVARLL